MTFIKINAITVPEDSGDTLAERFAHRAGAIDGVAGFQGFELLRPEDGRTTWLVVTRWDDEASYEGWARGDAFQKAHGGERRSPVGISAEQWSYSVVDFDAHRG